MGFGFNLLFFFVILPLSPIMIAVLLYMLAIGRKSTVKRISLVSGLIILSVIFLLGLNHWLNSKKVLSKEDYYGNYIIDRSYFPGKQADWQYNHFRFEIKENDSIYFYVTEQEKIMQTFKGSINVDRPSHSAILILNMTQPTHHIIASNPLINRGSWSFYLVFHSTKFFNVFFKKGTWRSIA